MAVSVAVVLAGSTAHIADVTATADADVSATVPHGLGAVPLDVQITPLLQAEALLSGWAATTIDATNIVLTASAAVGSGAATAQIRVKAALPHTLVR